MTDLFAEFLIPIYLGIFLLVATLFVLDAVRGVNKLKEVKKIIETSNREEKGKKKEANNYDEDRGDDRCDYE